MKQRNRDRESKIVFQSFRISRRNRKINATKCVIDSDRHIWSDKHRKKRSEIEERQWFE